MELVCRTTTIGATPALVVSGEVDLASVPQLHDAIRRLVEGHRGREVAVDLDGVGVLDDAGLGVLLGSAGRAREQGGDVIVVCTSPRVVHRLRVTGFDRAVDVRDRIAP